MSITGIYVECNRQAAAPSDCGEFVLTGQPAWVEHVGGDGTTQNAVPTLAGRVPYQPEVKFTLRITAFASAYVLVGPETYTPGLGNGVWMRAGDVLTYSAQPGDRVSWAATGEVPPPVFTIGAQGLYSGRSAYDSEAPGFVYLSTNGDAGATTTLAMLFFRVGAVSGTWSDGVVFQGPAGPTGPQGPAGTPAVYSNATPAAAGTAVPGTANEASRADHVHPAVPVATTVSAGLMSSGDKARLDSIEPTPQDYGAAGNGTTDDTAALASYEAVVTGKIVDLRNKTYLVSSIPTGNFYTNGAWKVGSTVYTAPQNRAVLSSSSDTGGVGAAYAGGAYDTPTVPGRTTDHLYALMASQGSRARGPARAATVASIYSEAHGNVSVNLAARQSNAWVPQSANIASEECSVWGGFRGVNLAAFHSKCENESNANIATRDSSAASRNGVNIAASGGYVGRGGGWRGVVTVSGGAVTAVTTAVDGSTAQTGRGYQVGDAVFVLDRQTGASNAVVAVATVDASGGILTCTVTSGGSGYGTTSSPDGNYYIDAYVDNGTGDFSANVATSGYTEACGTGSGNFASSGASGQYGSVTGINAAALGSSQHVVNADQAVAIAASGGSNTGNQSILTGVLNQVSATRAVVMGRRTINNQAGSFAIGDNGSGSASTANRKVHLFGNGNIQAAGTITGSVTFTDYAELFENLSHGIIPLGTIVALSGRKVRPAGLGDEILGVVSGTALVVAGDSPFTWAGRYLVGEFGEPLCDLVPDPDWPIEIPDPSWPTRVPNPDPKWDDDGALASPPTVPNPAPAPMIPNPVAAPLLRIRRENPAYDPSHENTPRSARPAEWTTVGLLGQVHVRVGADVGPDDWVAADGSRSSAPTKLRCMEIRAPYDDAKGYGVAFCLCR